MNVKVSVVVATFETDPEALARLVASLDAQTLPHDEFETIFVDDGSSGDVWTQLQAVRDQRDNVQIARIEHSGWPSRPRNVALALATGEYVFFADHDDEIFPDGLRAAWRFASEHDLDVAGVKTVQTGNPGHNFDSTVADRVGTRDEVGVLTLTPMTPHKLYRRQLLLDHDVRFPEGGRVMWEDVYYNLDAYAAAHRVGRLAAPCVYRHVVGTQNASLTYVADTEEYWRTVVAVMEHAVAVLGTDCFATDRLTLLTHQYRDRVLGRVVSLGAAGRLDALGVAMPWIGSIWTRWMPPFPPAGLPSRVRRVDELLRTHDPADPGTELETLARSIQNVVGTARTTALDWRGDTLHVAIEASLSVEPSVVAPGLLAAVGPDEQAAVEAEFAAATADLVLVRRDTGETEPLVTRRMSGGGQVLDPVASLTLRAEVGLGVDRPAGAVEVLARVAALGFGNTRGLRTDTTTRIGLVDGVAVVAYRTRRGMLAVDVGQTVRSVVNSAGKDFDRAVTSRSFGGVVRVDLPLTGVHVHGHTAIVGQAHLGPDTVVGEAVLLGDTAGPHLRLTVRAPAGVHPVSLTFGGRTVDAGFQLTVPGRFGRQPVVVSAR